jgi:hypothetical protein
MNKDRESWKLRGASEPVWDGANWERSASVCNEGDPLGAKPRVVRLAKTVWIGINAAVPRTPERLLQKTPDHFSQSERGDLSLVSVELQ